MSDRRVPPHNLGAERALLGAVLLRGKGALMVASEIGLSPDDLYHPAHKMILEAALRLEALDKPVDTITVASELRVKEQLRRIEGQEAYLSGLLDDIPSVEHAGHYARLIKEASSLRRLILACGELAAGAYGDPGDVADFLDNAEKQIFELGQTSHRGSYIAVNRLLKDTVKTVLERKNAGKSVTGVATGFRDLDEMTSGLQPGDLDVIAARPSMGKTSFALSIAQNAALLNQVPVLVFSLEMTQKQLIERMLCSEARIDMTKLRSGFLGSHEWINLTKAASRLHEAPIFLDESSAPTILEIRAKARRFASDPEVPRRKGEIPGMIVVDYIQLVRGTGGGREESREREVAEVSRGLKAIAKELGMPVVALSQLNRALEKREDKRPLLSDLRESGAIEQDADLISFIYRDEFYRKDKSDKQGIAEIIIGKNRNGPTDTIELSFLGAYTRFESLSQREDAA